MEKIINYKLSKFSKLADKNKNFIENIKFLERKKYIKSEINKNQSLKIIFLDNFKKHINGKRIKKENSTKILCEYDFRKILKKRCIKCLG